MESKASSPEGSASFRSGSEHVIPVGKGMEEPRTSGPKLSVLRLLGAADDDAEMAMSRPWL